MEESNVEQFWFESTTSAYFQLLDAKQAKGMDTLNTFEHYFVLLLSFWDFKGGLSGHHEILKSHPSHVASKAY